MSNPKHLPNENQQYWTRLDDQSVNQHFLRTQAVTDDVTENMVVRWDAAQLKWTPAVTTVSGLALTLQNTLGVAIQVDAINHISNIVLKGGNCPGFTGLTAGADYWLSATAGGITATRPVTSPAIKIGRALTTTTLFLDITFFRYDNFRLSPIDWAQKEAHVGDWTLTSGSSTVLYDSAIDGRFGTGVYKFTGTGTWVLNAMYPCSPLYGIGGHIMHATASGAGSLSVGVEQYNGAFVFQANLDFIMNSTATNTTWAVAQGLVSQTESSPTMNANCRWIRPRLVIVSNPGTIYIDGWNLYNPAFARISMLSYNANVAAFATTANYA